MTSSASQSREGQSVYMAQRNIKHKNQASNKANFQERNDLSWLQLIYSFLVSGDTQCGDSGGS